MKKMLLHWWRYNFSVARDWCVRYRSGDISMGMDYSMAYDYAEIFGGEVIKAVEK